NISFEDAGRSIGLGEEISSFPTWSFDYNNDGWMDIFVAGYKRSSFYTIVPDIVKEYLGEPNRAESMRLYRNEGGTFTDVSAEVGLNKIGYAMGANYGDLDNYGYHDSYLLTGEDRCEFMIRYKIYRMIAVQDC